MDNREPTPTRLSSMVERQFVELVTVVRFHDSGPFAEVFVIPTAEACRRSLERHIASAGLRNKRYIRPIDMGMQ